jgi:hypothetical protein
MGCSKSETRSWVETAHQLRQVRRACLLFLDRWAIGRLMAPHAEPTIEAAVEDFANRDWSNLYRGNILDD